ncbi:MAG: hypothetical protein JW808_05600, partial [Victivallales bacterium]|nr:hypothetical protein [Victivallales bacterium]
IESHEMFGGMLYSSEPDGLPHVCYTAIGVRMTRGLSGEAQERLVANYPNRGAIPISIWISITRQKDRPQAAHTKVVCWPCLSLLLSRINT